MTGRIERVVLADGDVSVALLSLGCITQDWQVPLDGEPTPVVLGYRDPEAYLSNPAFLGAVVGRVANRIAGSSFNLAGRQFNLPANDGPHHLHGGKLGVGTRIWQADRDGNRSVRFRYRSPDGEAGYPGTVAFEVRVTLAGSSLTYDMRAVPDRPTPINLAQHNYYALSEGPVTGQTLTVAATGFTPAGPDLIPVGEIAPFAGQTFDFRAERRLSQDHRSLDLNYVLDPGAQPAATLRGTNGLTLDLWTDRPGLQVYTAGNLAQFADPLPGQTHAPFHAICLEPQGFPNAVNTPAFPAVIATPDAPYRQVTRIAIRPDNGA